MNPIRRQRLFLILGGIAAVAIAVALIFFALGQNLNLYFPPAKVQSGEAPMNQQIRVGGMVLPGSIIREEGSLKVEFQVTDYAANLTIEYTGILPDMFKENQGVIAKGELVDKTRFVATEVLAKHDENYTPKEVQDSLNENGHGLKQ